MFRKILFIFILWLFCLAWALHLPFSESEIWGLFLSEKMMAGEDFFHSAFVYKASFHGLFGAWGLLFSHSDTYYLGSRFLISFIIPLIASLSLWTENKGRWFELIMIFIFAAPFVFLYGIAVRADLLAILLALIIFWSLARNQSFWVLSVLNILLLLCTPKSIFLIGALFAASVVLRRGKRYLQSLVFPFLVLALLIVWSSLDAKVILAYSSAWNFFVESYDESLGRPSYWSLDSFTYLLKFLTSSPLWFALWIVGIWRAWRGAEVSEKALAVFSMVCLLALIIHNDKLPFFLAAFALAGFSSVRLGWSAMRGRWRWYVFGAAAIWSVALYLNAWRNYSNYEQLHALRVGEAILKKEPQLRVFDGTGLFAKVSGEMPYFLGPSQPEQKTRMLKTLLSFDPHFIFYTSKLLYGEPELSEYMRAHEYAHLGGGVYSRGIRISVLDEIPDGRWVLHAGQEYYVVTYQKWVDLLRSKTGLSKSLSSFASPKDGDIYAYPPLVDDVTLPWERQLLFKDARGTFRSYGDYLNSAQNIFTEVSEVYIPRDNTLELIVSTTSPWKGSRKPFSELFAFPRDLIPGN